MGGDIGGRSGSMSRGYENSKVDKMFQFSMIIIVLRYNMI